VGRAPEGAHQGGLNPWVVEIPGQPISVNHLYRQTLVRRGDRTVRALRKDDGVENYQVLASMCTKMAVPKPWKEYLAGSPKEYIRMRYWFFLNHDMDCSNAFKALEDAIAHALGINDKRFLPCAVAKTTGNKEPYVKVEVSVDG